MLVFLSASNNKIRSTSRNASVDNGGYYTRVALACVAGARRGRGIREIRRTFDRLDVRGLACYAGVSGEGSGRGKMEGGWCKRQGTPFLSPAPLFFLSLSLPVLHLPRRLYVDKHFIFV